MRFCLDCLDGQLAEHGFAAWMVAHQLPGLPVCAVHGRWLRDSLVTRTSAGRHGYVAPSLANCPAVVCPDPEADVPPILLSLAREAQAIATVMTPSRPLSHWRGHYVDGLADVGLMRSPRKADQVRLNDGLAAYWASALPHLPPACASFGERGWAAAMVREHRKAMHPLLHLMMDGFLRHLEAGGAMPHGGLRATMDVAARAPRLPANPQSGRVPKVDWPTLDATLVSRIGQDAKAVAALIPPVRVTPAEVERRVAKAGWFGKRRAKLPLAMAALVAIEETLVDFQRRRAAYWAGELGPGCRPWEVMRAAGLRTEQLPMIREVVSAPAAASDAR